MEVAYKEDLASDFIFAVIRVLSLVCVHKDAMARWYNEKRRL